MKMMEQILKFAGAVLAFVLQGAGVAAGDVDDNDTYHRQTDTDYYGTK